MNPSGFDFTGTLRRLRLAATTMALALLAAACGPGVGGTGTGPSDSALPAFSAAAANVCTGELAVLLACGGSGASSTAPAAGSAAVDFADPLPPHRVALRIEGNRAELSAPCAGLQFSGEWGQIGGQPARFYGRVGSELATLVAVPAGSGISVQVFDARAVSLFGPQVVERQSVAVTPDCR